MKIKPIFAWYDIWIGVFIDRKKHCIYVFPIPMFGLKINWKQKYKRIEREMEKQ